MNGQQQLGAKDLDALAARMQQGDERAIEAFAKGFGVRLRNYFLWHGLPSSAAEDLAVDSTSDIVLRLQRFVSRGEGSFARWCFRIARNKMTDWHRENQRVAEFRSEVIRASAVSSGNAALPVEVQQALDSGLDALKESDREILLLRHFSYATTFAEMAEIVGISTDAARTRYLRARQRLAKRLKSDLAVKQWLQKTSVQGRSSQRRKDGES